MLVTQVCPTLCDLMDCSPPGSSAHGIPGKNIGVGCYLLIQEIFWTQGLNSYLMHWQVGSLPLSYQGSPLKHSKECLFLELFFTTLINQECKVLVAQLCRTLCDLMNYSPPGTSVHGILQARILE